MLERSERYQVLDAFRGIAALLVVFFHFTMGREEANYGFVYGKTGVDLFFIISGFVIFRSVDKNSSAKGFLIKRFNRLYPTYWIVVTFTFLLILFYPYFFEGVIDKVGVYEYIVNLTMFQNYFQIIHVDGSYWTLMIEMNFYLIIFLLLVFRIFKYFIPICVALIAYQAIILNFDINNFAVNKIAFIFPILMYVPLFLAGICFYKIYTQVQSKWRYYSILFICFWMKILFLKIDYTGEISFLTFEEHAITQTIYFTLFLLFITNKLNFIVNKITLFLGKISFALYLIHQFVSLKYLIPFATDYLKLNFWFSVFFIVLPIVLILASLITFYIEIPFNRRLNKLFLKTKN